MLKDKKKSHITIPVKREINEKELVNLVASFICSHEEISTENASIGQEGNHYVVQVRKEIADKKGTISQVEIVTVQLTFMPRACIVAFSTNRGKAEAEKLKKTAGKAVAAEAGIVGAGTLVTAVSSGVIAIGLSPLAIAALPVAGVAVTAKALSASGKAKESRQLKDDVFAIVCDYLGYTPNDPAEETDDDDMNNEQNQGDETGAGVCECGYVFKDKVQFCPQCGKKVHEPAEKKCECGTIISEGIKFCPQCGKRVE